MSKISSMLDVGKRSLSNSQTALQTVAHNIANKSTEGYSRQRVDIVSNGAVGEGAIRIGQGARAAQVSRINNPWLEKQIQREDTNLGYAEGRADAMARVEQIYNEQQNKGLNQYVTDFFNAYRELSNNPENLTSRTMVKEAAYALAMDFRRVDGQLQDVQKDIDGQISTTVQEVNQFTREIASLNEKIQLVEVQGNKANDERDRRDMLLKKLGEKVEISWAEGNDGMVNVTAGGTAILVSGTSSMDLYANTSSNKDRIEIFYKNSPTGSMFNVTQQMTGGRLGGILNVRDQVVDDYRKSNDEMAYQISKEVNAIHIEGFDRYGKSGVLFFEMPDEVSGAAAMMSVNNTILTDVGKIAAGNKPGAPGDNTIANMVSALQYQGIMNDKTDTLDSYYNSLVGKIGTLAQRSTKSFESQKNIVSQLGNIRESLSGVSLDEETTKMIEMQKAYEASARVIKMADEMLDTVLNLRRT